MVLTTPHSTAEFVLLEQILPDGPDHPFAATMLSHFNKLNTQLKSVHVYPALEDQRKRFLSRGWNTVDVWTLWQTWADQRFLSDSDRRRLEHVEAFDEWEEFALFASHYCVVHARASTSADVVVPAEAKIPKDVKVSLEVEEVALRFDECSGQRGQRRFGAAMQVSPPRHDEGGKNGGDSSVLTNVMGLGTKSRLQSCDVFSQKREGSDNSSSWFRLNEGGPTTRMCHSLTELGGKGGEYLLSGGRDSPVKSYKDCWIFNTTARTWKRTHDLPTPLYRHSVAGLGGGKSGQALLIGGKGPEGVFDGCLVYRPENGWVSCEVIAGHELKPTYGSLICCFPPGSDLSKNGVFTGVYAGGLLDDGIIADQILAWKLDVSNAEVCSCGSFHCSS